MSQSDTSASHESGTMPTKCTTCEALCHRPVACEDCHAVLDHVQGADFFELFGLPRSYEIDLGDLDDRYFAISRNVHPDRYAGEGPEMQAFALRTSAAINNAYNVLRSPLHRAEYLLEAAGGKSAAEDKSVPKQLLPQVMMLREEIDEAKASNDTATLETMKEQLLQKRRATEETVASLCSRLHEDGDETKKELRLQLNAIKYFNNLLNQL